jgi:hypothetical protein
VLLARDAPVGVVLGRGPSKLVCAVGWDRRTDDFRLGQWLAGRIHEHSADISPDGRWWVYGGSDHRGRRAHEVWTALAGRSHGHGRANHAAARDGADARRLAAGGAARDPRMGSMTWEREAPGGWKVRKLFFDAGTPERNRLVSRAGYEIRAGVPGPRGIEDERVLVDLAAWRFERRRGRDPRAGSC